MIIQQPDHVEMRNISKSFGGIKAIDNVCFGARKGEVHALMGENGAGKSTLMKVLAGAYTKDTGEIFIDGKKANINEPKDSRALGVSIIYQEFALATHLTVAENIFIDNLGNGKRTIQWKRLYEKAKALLNELGFGDIDVKAKVEELSVAYQQVVEICKALSRKSNILVFDEPTAVLASNEVNQLFRLIRNLKANGVCIIYISHRIEEIFTICDRISIMKDGQLVDTVRTQDIDEDRLVTKMIGRKLAEFFPPRHADIGEEVLNVRDLCCGKRVRAVSLTVKKGEILGINGLVGAGRTETVRAIFGADRKEAGTIRLFGKEQKIKNPQAAVKLGIGMLPEDRKRNGVLLNLPIRYNITMTSLKSLSNRFGWINTKKEKQKIDELVDKLRIKISAIDENVSSLSGGNQQKVALAKWLGSDCRILIFDEPTRGVDVGAKVEIYKIMNRLAEEGAAIIMISSEMSEIIGMSDRVIVMREGRVMGELDKSELNEENLIKLSMGVSGK